MLLTNNRAEAFALLTGFNGHPPLGVNATKRGQERIAAEQEGFNGHPPLGVNATMTLNRLVGREAQVSMGTHPWG